MIHIDKTTRERWKWWGKRRKNAKGRVVEEGVEGERTNWEEKTQITTNRTKNTNSTEARYSFLHMGPSNISKVDYIRMGMVFLGTDAEACSYLYLKN